MKRLAFSTSLFILLIIAISVAIGAGDVAYIYNSDQDAANSFDSLSG